MSEREVTIINDSEKSGAGAKGAEDTAALLHKLGVRVRIATLPRPEGVEKIDVAEALRDGSVDDLKAIFSAAILYEGSSSRRRQKSSPTARKMAIRGDESPGTQSASTNGSAVEATLDVRLEALRTELRSLKPEIVDGADSAGNTIDIAAAIHLALDGKSMAPHGQRDNTMFRVASRTMRCTSAASLEIDSIAELYRSSLEMWANEADAELSVDAELEKMCEKLLRAREYFERSKSFDPRNGKHSRMEEECSDEVLAPLLRGVLLDELSRWEIEHSARKAAIIQFGKSYWVMGFNGQRATDYLRPFVESELWQAANEEFHNAPAVLALNTWTEGTDTSPPRRKNGRELVDHYGSLALRVQGSLILQESRWDRRQRVLTEALCPLRKLAPRFNDDIAEWLIELAGNKIEKLLDWLAALPRLDRQCCALFLVGASGAGKGLLSQGCSRLWTTGGPTDYALLLRSQFNAELFRCPFALLDEGISFSGSKVSTHLRNLVGSSSHQLHEKFHTPRSVSGAVRLMIAGNNDRVLELQNESLGLDDLEAVSSRILLIEARKEGAAWLHRRNEGQQLTRSWIDDDLLARHILYLAETRDIKSGKRFLVEGDESSFSRRLVTTAGGASIILELIFEGLQELVGETGKQGDPLKQGLWVRDGSVLVNSSALKRLWKKREQHAAKPRAIEDIGSVGRTLRNLSRQGTIRIKAKRRSPAKAGSGPQSGRFHVLDSDTLRDWAFENQLLEPEDFDALLKRIEEKINAIVAPVDREDVTR